MRKEIVLLALPGSSRVEKREQSSAPPTTYLTKDECGKDRDYYPRKQYDGEQFRMHGEF
jgi:hypothetical protein